MVSVTAVKIQLSSPMMVLRSVSRPGIYWCVNGREGETNTRTKDTSDVPSAKGEERGWQQQENTHTHTQPHFTATAQAQPTLSMISGSIWVSTELAVNHLSAIRIGVVRQAVKMSAGKSGAPFG